MKRERIANICLVGSLLLAAVLLFFALRGCGAEPGTQFEIRVDGKLYGRYALGVERTVQVEDLLTVRVEQGRVYVTESNCPQGSCVRHAPISRVGERILCLPQRVEIRICGEGEPDFVLRVPGTEAAHG